MRITRHPLLAPVDGLHVIPPDELVIARLGESHALVRPVLDSVIDRVLDRAAALVPAIAAMLRGEQGRERAAVLRRSVRATLELIFDRVSAHEPVHDLLRELGLRITAAEIRRAECALLAAVFQDAVAESLGEAWTPMFAEELRRALDVAMATMLEADPAARTAPRGSGTGAPRSWFGRSTG
ncbi:MAG TPA: hypothetical protein PKC43_01280 [Phycisphaerales bacterium]|nr:hypothetical protein [Phycisphaerales bacterium]HMP36057.1 hypothetical protein [Phycisphaerales bacterium]